MKLRILLAVSMALALGAAAADDIVGAPSGGDVVVARRGGVTLTASQLKSALASEPADARAKLASDPASLAGFVQSVLLGRVLLSQAEAAKWDRTPAVQAALARAHDTLVIDSYLADKVKPAAGYPSEADIAAAYQQNISKLMQPRRYHLLQILVALPANPTPSDDSAARAKAEALREQATKPTSDFAKLAAGASNEKAVIAAKGDMGWVPEDKLLPAIKSAVAGLAVGGISQPVRTDAGWHVLQLAGTKAAGPASLAEVHDQLAQVLQQQKARQDAQAYLDDLLKQQPVELNTIAIGSVLGSHT